MHELFPPVRFRIVNDSVYAGAYPTLRNLRFMRRLKLRTIVSLIPEPPTTDLKEFCDHEKIECRHIYTEKYKNVVSLSFADITKIIEMLIDTRLHPIYIHCLGGTNPTSLVIMCLRKLQNWNQKTTVKEAERYTEEFSSEDMEILKQWKGEVNFPDAQFLPKKWLHLPSPKCDVKDRQHPKGIKIVGYFIEEVVEEKKKPNLKNINLADSKAVLTSIKDSKEPVHKRPSYVEFMTLSSIGKTPRVKHATSQRSINSTRNKKILLAALDLEVKDENIERVKADTTSLEIPAGVLDKLDRISLPMFDPSNMHSLT
ncbi:OCA6 [Acrasis kona]|uniref:OCA6 n=1 Tax=Acrasis kona TaxID=1008807 RepID=A0AAW2ZBT4_9EUKA